MEEQKEGLWSWTRELEKGWKEMLHVTSSVKSSLHPSCQTFSASLLCILLYPLFCNSTLICLIVCYSHQTPIWEKASTISFCLLFKPQHSQQLSPQRMQKLLDEMGKLYREVLSRSSRFIFFRILSPVFSSLLLTTFIRVVSGLYCKGLTAIFCFLIQQTSEDVMC